MGNAAGSRTTRTSTWRAGARRCAFSATNPSRRCSPSSPPPEPTVEGLAKQWPNAHPALCIFTAEGGQFTGGHAMSDDSRLRSAAALSAIWDGTPIKRVRALDGVSVLRGRRLAMHLMLQPSVAGDFLSHPTLRDQGILSRVLVAAPESLAGSRLYREASAEEEAIRAYGARLLAILEAPATMAEGKRNELEPRALPLSADARRIWLAFHDHVERQVGPDGPLRPVRDLAAKAAEHAARIAGVIAVTADLRVKEIDAVPMGNAAELVGWYLGEALRPHAAGRTDPALLQAAALLGWMQDQADGEGRVAFRDVLRLGPNATRKLDAAEAALKVLTRHGWVEEVSSRPAWCGCGPLGTEVNCDRLSPFPHRGFQPRRCDTCESCDTSRRGAPNRRNCRKGT